jgi:hypothetical protein
MARADGLELAMAETDQESELVPFGTADLEALLTKLSAPSGVTVAELQALLADLASRPLSDEHLAALREGKGAWKKLAEEVFPVAAYLSATTAPQTRVRFPLDSEPPDAWLLDENGKPQSGIEVTGALARARAEIAKSLRENKPTAGFLALQDNASSAAFAAARERGRILHSRKHVDQTLIDGIVASLGKKANAQLPDHTLLVVAPLGSSPNLDPDEIRTAVADAVEPLSFASVILIDPRRTSPIIVPIK